MEIDEVIIKESPGLCRCCLSEGCYKDLASEYPWMGENEVYADMLLECFDIGISQHADGPNGPNRLICEVCITRLRDACNFKKQVVEAEKRFVDMLGRGDFRMKNTHVVEISGMKLEPTLEEDPPEEEVEYLEDIDFGDDEPLQKLASTSKQYTGQSTSNDVAVPAKKTRGRPRKSTATVKVSKSKTSDIKPKATRTKDSGKERTGKLSAIQRRENLRILFNNTTVLPFKWRGQYRCFYCSKSIKEYDELRMHTLSHGQCSVLDHSLKVIKGGYNMEVKIDISDIECNVCRDKFPTLVSIVDHLRVKHDLEYVKAVDNVFEEYRVKDLTCHVCDASFKYFGYLVSHMNTSHPKNVLVCDICKRCFNKRRDLFSHVKNYHREGGYVCDFCQKTFTTLNILRKHRNNRHLTRCNVCFVKLPSAALKTKHMQQEHPDDDSLECNGCSKIFHTKQGLKMHSKKCKTDEAVFIEAIKNENEDDESSDERTVKRQSVKKIKSNLLALINMTTAMPFSFYKNKFNCFFCSEDFVDCDELKEHTSMAHAACDAKSKCIKKCRESNTTIKIDISNLECRVCFQTMQDLDAVIDHIIEKHTSNYDRTVKSCFQPYKLLKDSIQCPHCNMVFRYFGTLLKHINSNHTDNNIICVHCGQLFRKEQNLRVHVYRHHKEGQFKCNVCDAECSMPSRLYMHMAKIHGVKAAKCTKCDERFETQYLRQKHLIDVHNIGHKCNYCGKLFVRDSFMKDHVRRTHLKEKNVECSICSMKFFNNILLRRHMVKHSGEKNYHCDICGERFFWRKGLVRHMGRHNKQQMLNNV